MLFNYCFINILILDSIESLKDNKQRYKFWKMRRSHAAHLIAQENEEITNKEMDDERMKTTKCKNTQKTSSTKVLMKLL